MRLLLFPLIVLLAQLALCAEGRAQTPAPSCPEIKIKCPSGLWDQGEKVPISVEVLSTDAYLTANLKYKWMVSAGEIVSGQGTPEITVDTTGLGGNSVTATVDIDGLPAGCDRTESCSLSPVCGVPPSRLFDKYGKISEHDEMVALDNFAEALKAEPGAQAYVIVDGGLEPPDYRARLDRIKNYLVNEGGIDASRITAVDAGRRKEFQVQLWIRPTGAMVPDPRF